MNFVSNTYPTVGVEEEFHLVDPKTGGLVSKASEVIASASTELGTRVCNELFESIIESRTGIYQNVSDLHNDIIEYRLKLNTIAAKQGVAIAAAGSHPFSDWKKQKIVAQEHYHWVEEQFHCVAQRLIAMGLHIHVGVKSDKAAFYVMSKMKRWAPALTALSCNSPFFEGEDYGYKSTRMHLFHSLPRTGFLPDFKTMDDYISFYNTLEECGDVVSMKDMWWSIRPKPEFGTVEYRLFDLPTDARIISAITALVQAATAFYQDEFFNNPNHEECCPIYLEECLWKSYRDGLDAMVTDPLSGAVTTARSMIQELLMITRDKAKELESVEHYKTVEEVLASGTEADKQKKFFYANNSNFKALELDIVRRTT